MRIGCLQFAPQVGDIDNNLNRADSVLSKANPDDLDILVLPELAFSGYNFKSLQDIAPFLEPSGSGITSLWARTIALKYNCVVLAGYPEKVDVSPNWPTGPEYYNSAIVVNGDGETIANYRKSFLYYTDESWALEGNRGFFDGFIPGLGNTSIGICMDINPYKFEAPWDAFEFAFHVLEVESNLVVVSMAWMTREDRRHYSRMPNEPDMDTLSYWVTRLEPLIRSENEEEIIVVFCNRTGTEDEATYAGTSAVIGIRDGEVNVYGLLGRGEKELLVVDTAKSAYAKLLYRPDGGLSKQKAAEVDKVNAAAASAETRRMDDDKELESGKSRRDNQFYSDSKRSDSKALPLTPAGEPSRTTLALEESPAAPAAPAAPDEDVSKKQKKRRQTPSISIPARFEATDQGETIRSPTTEYANIPTPSAPSPTPQAIRPRLIIPQSPTLFQSQQQSQDNPMSAASMRSIQSVQSVQSVQSIQSIQSIRSNESEASTQTIRSNPRPPEDSTPYPHSGLPLSGYPSNSFRSEKRIYGGQVTMTHSTDNNGFTPTTPFYDVSPTQSRWFWRAADASARTPMAGSMAGGTPIGRRPEPFPWPDILPTARPQSRGDGSDGAKSAVMVQETRQEIRQEMRQKNTPSPQSNTSSNKSRKSRTSTGTPQPEPSLDEKLPARPPSPKSRNASRSRMRSRSGSTASQYENAATVVPNQERVPSRPESRAKVRDRVRGSFSVHDRPSSSQSRTYSRSRSRSGRGSDKMSFLSREHQHQQQQQQTIPIVASPSLLSGNVWRDISTPVAMDYYLGPSSRAGQQATPPIPESFGHLNSEATAAVTARRDKVAKVDGPSWSIASSIGYGTPVTGARPASRGRATQVVRDHDGERASSADSTRNGRLHTRMGRRPSQDTGASGSGSGPGGRRSSRKGSASGRRPSRGGNNEAEFERVEVVNCPECPVHGRHSASGESSGGSAGSKAGSSSLGGGESSRGSPGSKAGSASLGKSGRMHRPETGAGVSAGVSASVSASVDGSASRGSSTSRATKRSQTTNSSVLSGRTDMAYKQDTTAGSESRLDATVPRSVHEVEDEV